MVMHVSRSLAWAADTKRPSGDVVRLASGGAICLSGKADLSSGSHAGSEDETFQAGGATLPTPEGAAWQGCGTVSSPLCLHQSVCGVGGGDTQVNTDWTPRESCLW